MLFQCFWCQLSRKSINTNVFFQVFDATHLKITIKAMLFLCFCDLLIILGLLYIYI